MRWDLESEFLKSGSLSSKIGTAVIANMFLFFLLGIFFDGGAYPWGEIRDEA